ncbi:MBL fold metallo-hydrolase [Aquimonas sp.]|jgi:hydroxyacylglutathione hydrolase|uniref:MBL fold metallo-hydrolase n=1 Tax=Aquimonas sp. TaxID=1872588 RepID=UPI0037BF6D59
MNQAVLQNRPDSSPRVFLIEVERGRMKNNNYLIVDPSSRQAVLVDPAWQVDKLQATIAAADAQVSGILLTHAHYDHIDLARPLAEFYNCPIWMSAQEVAHSGFGAPSLQPIDERPWQVGGLWIEPILTPGHTPGCVCFRIGDNLFTGDVLFAEGCGICTSVDAAHQMFDSLEMLKRRLPPQVHVFPGHTYVRPPGQRFGDVQGFNMYLQFRDRDSFAAYRLRRGQSAQSLLNFR